MEIKTREPIKWVTDTRYTYILPQNSEAHKLTLDSLPQPHGLKFLRSRNSETLTTLHGFKHTHQKSKQQPATNAVQPALRKCRHSNLILPAITANANRICCYAHQVLPSSIWTQQQQGDNLNFPFRSFDGI